MASVEMDLSAFAGFLQRKAEDLARLDLSPALRECSLLAKSATLQNFQGQHDPEGTPWIPLKPQSRRRPRDKRAKKRGGRPMILVDSGILRASVNSGPQHVERITSTSMEVGTAVDCGRWHMTGTRRMPARPFLGWTPQLVQQCEDVVADFLAKKLGSL